MIEPRALVVAPLGGRDPKPRIAIVLDGERDATVIVIAVTGTERDLDRVQVDANSRDAKALGLYKTSYFYAANIAAVPVASCRVQPMRCPPGLFERLLDLRRRAIAAGTGSR